MRKFRRAIAWSIVVVWAAPFVSIFMCKVWSEYYDHPREALVGIGLTVAGFALWWAVVELIGTRNERI
jgi:hypothetical protein